MLCLLHLDAVITENKSTLQNLGVPPQRQGRGLLIPSPLQGRPSPQSDASLTRTLQFLCPQRPHFLFLKSGSIREAGLCPGDWFLLDHMSPSQIAVPTAHMSEGEFISQEWPHSGHFYFIKKILNCSTRYITKLAILTTFKCTVQ